MRKKIDIEGLLAWAYREELPKAAGNGGVAGIANGWAGVSSYAELLTVVDHNEYGCVPNLADGGEPDPDAVRVHEAVVALDSVAIDLPDGWSPMEELGQHGELGEMAVAVALDTLTVVDGAGVRRLRNGPARLVRKHAILGGVPEWQWDGEEPAARIVTGPEGGPLWFRERVSRTRDAFGKVMEYRYETADGWDKYRNRPKRGAYQKAELHPDPLPLILARAEYELWHASLECLVEDLRPVLERFELAEFRRSPRPWQTPDKAAPRVLVANAAFFR
ncbi:hypothetical protein H2509_20325 [Stappia sp. F7233]|uniref:Uncharacterized protein n=1 Tax=Stappia albiluteola TaxID=2758565 RepID=A0A839AID0_9HYPH|nr:hypothetical protein [Stappia albiluteola]MBA5779483.1 hypothetical protein [Stappia albiluteola]